MSRTVIVGGGIVGLACAYSLRRRGRDVVVVERDGLGEACSKGNAGWITPSVSAPIPAPGLTWTSIKWMLRSDSPLYIAPAAAPGLARWLWRFWRFCNPRDFERGLRVVAGLNRRTLALFDELERDGIRFELHRDGLLFVFAEEGSLEGALAELAHYRAFGYEVPTPIDRAALRRMEPALSEQVVAGFLVSQEYHVRPETLARGYADRLVEMGVEIQTGVAARKVAIRGPGSVAVMTPEGTIAGSELVIAAGAWTGRIAQQLGVALPVQAGKGYSITLTGSGIPELTRPLYLGEAKVGCSPFDGAVRFAGTMELSGINTDLDHRRVRGIRKGIARFLGPAVGDAPGEEWVGMRPLTPDGVPLLGRLPGFRDVYVATGHGMAGVTLAPATGEAIADLITGVASDADLEPFDPGRFRW